MAHAATPLTIEDLRTEISTMTNTVSSNVTAAIERKFGEKIACVVSTVTKLDTKVSAVEKYAAHQYDMARSKLLQTAEKDYDVMTQKMFKHSSLVLSTPASARRPTGRGSPSPAADPSFTEETRAAVQAYVVDAVGTGKYTVEKVKGGIRLVHTGRSARVRRSDAERLVAEHRGPLESRFGLFLHYDRPYEYRSLLKNARDFLAALKKKCPTISKFSVSNGVCLVDSIPVGPAWLVPPGSEKWAALLDTLARDFGQLPTDPSLIDKRGYFTPLFADAYVASAGILPLSAFVDEG